MCPTYKSTSKFKNALNRYMTSLRNGDSTITYSQNANGIKKAYDIKKRQLELVFPDVPLTKEQEQIISDFINDANTQYGINVVITIVTT